jgi:hypothetical protein
MRDLNHGWFAKVNAPAAPVDETFHRRFLSDSSLAPGEAPPEVVVLTGGVSSGKSTVRRKMYGGHVPIDPGEIYNAITRRDEWVPANIGEWVATVGRALAHDALVERRNIVIEIVLLDEENGLFGQVVSGLGEIGFHSTIVYIECDPAEAWERNVNRGPHDISSVYYGIDTLAWMIDAISAVRGAMSSGGKNA